MHHQYTLTGTSLTHKFERKKLFSRINISLKSGNSLAITGPNGSGKSTLIHILAKLQKPTSGTLLISNNDTEIPDEELYQHIGFTGPLINPYKELTGCENLSFTLPRGADQSKASDLLRLFDLFAHKDKKIRNYSTGMIQRLKYITAVINDPPILFLDEPGSNLDDKGKSVTYDHIKTMMNNAIVVIATNDQTEAALCSREISLGS